MSNIHTEKNLVRLEIGYGETLEIGFMPDGANALPGSKVVYFRCSYHILPNGRVALGVHFPDGLYHSGNQFLILDDPNGADKLEIGRLVLERVTPQHFLSLEGENDDRSTNSR